MKILLYVKQVVLTLAVYTMSGWSLEGTNRLCMSNESPLEGLVYYWEDQMKKKGMTIDGLSGCRIGEGELKEMSNKTIMKMIEEVQLSISPLRFSCHRSLNESGVSIEFNGLDDTDPGYHIVDCDNHKIYEDLGVLVGDGSVWESRYNKSFNEEIKLKSDQLRSAMADLDRLSDLRVDDQNEINSLIRENQMLMHKISNITGVAYNYNNSLQALLAEALKRDTEFDLMKKREEQLKKDLREHQERIKTIDNGNIKNNDKAMKKEAHTTTTPKALLMTTVAISLLSPSYAITHPSLLNPYPHVKNRIGSGLYRFDTEDDSTCRGLDYNTNCLGFDHMLRPDRYPFFNSFVMHLTPLEAYADNILEKEGDSCEMGKNKDSKCLDGRRFMKASCPQGINGVYYINDKGKLSHSRCKESEYEITEDCVFCRKIKKKGSKSIMKTSVSIQDAICQASQEEYRGPKVPFKGVCEVGSVSFKSCTKFVQGYENVPFVTFKNYGKMYIDRMITKNLELVNSVSFICYEHKGQDGTEIELRELKRVKMSECKNVNSSKTKHCTGDQTFCEKYGCSGTYPEVTCLTAPGSGPVLVNILGSWLKPQCLGYEKVLVKREIKTSLITFNQECETCVYRCEEEGIRVTSTGFRITTAVSCSHGLCLSTHQSPQTTILIPYPGLSSASGGPIGVHISHTEDSVSLHLTVYCEPQDICKTLHCFFCLNGLINYQCHSVLSSVITSMMISLSIYVVLVVIGKLLYMCKLIPKKLRSPFTWLRLLGKWIITLVKLSLVKLTRKINQTIGWDSNNQRPEVHLREVRVRRALPRYATTAFVIFLLLPLSLGCSETLISNSKQTKCVQSSGTIKCSVSATITLKAGVIGAESCFIIKGPMDNQHKTIRVRTISSEVVCREGNSFWTSHYVPNCLSSRRCHLVGECTGTRCQSWNDDEISMEFKNTKDNMVMNENKCFEQCGAIGCGCFNINPSCLFVHTTMRAVRPEAIRVFSCADWIHRLTLEVVGPDGEKERFTLGSLGTKFLSWGTVSLSLDAEGISGTNSLSFLESSKGGFAIYDESFSEVPREGFLGEVRCSSESAAIAAHSSCLRAPNLIKYKPMTDLVECTASLIDPFAAFTKGSLPQVRNGMTYTSSIDKKTVQAFNSGSIKALITMTMDDHEIQFLSESKKCDATFLNISGCYSCNYGSRVCVRIKVDGNANFLASNPQENFYLSFNLWSGTRDYCQLMHFNSPEVDLTTTYSCGGDGRILHIKGLLISMSLDYGRNKTGGSSTLVNPSEQGWNILNWISGLTTWLGGTWVAIGKILGFLLLGVVILLILISFLSLLGKSLLKKTKLM
ncbi:polyprotein [Nique virus]|uniref:Envelopment polyprotein n=1 Tax=Nique virus TaxID=629739 RepID=F2W3S5_9VIRU|nr:polyprotein [Nique virus]AEA30050.1 polyprotein [Nique virus]